MVVESAEQVLTLSSSDSCHPHLPLAPAMHLSPLLSLPFSSSPCLFYLPSVCLFLFPSPFPSPALLVISWLTELGRALG